MTFSYWLYFNPLCKLVNHNQDMSHISSCRFKRADHIQTPYGKWPGNWYGLELRHWHMCLGSISLTAIALSYQILCLFQGAWPVKPMMESLCYQGSGRGVMPTFPLMYISEDVKPFFRVN